MDQVIQIDESADPRSSGVMVRGTVEEALNGLLGADAYQLCGAGCYERGQARQARYQINRT